MNEEVQIKESTINGLGLFALRKFKSGEIVLRWDITNRISSEEVEKLTENEKKYLEPFGDGTFIVMQSPAKYVNHSCNNNTIVKDFCDIAIRDIKIGEEITSDYNTNADEQSFGCNCGANLCKGSIK